VKRRPLPLLLLIPAPSPVSKKGLRVGPRLQQNRPPLWRADSTLGHELRTSSLSFCSTWLVTSGSPCSGPQFPHLQIERLLKYPGGRSSCKSKAEGVKAPGAKGASPSPFYNGKMFLSHLTALICILKPSCLWMELGRGEGVNKPSWLPLLSPPPPGGAALTGGMSLEDPSGLQQAVPAGLRVTDRSQRAWARGSH
jgi:hypothetical protein